MIHSIILCDSRFRVSLTNSICYLCQGRDRRRIASQISLNTKTPRSSLSVFSKSLSEKTSVTFQSKYSATSKSLSQGHQKENPNIATSSTKSISQGQPSTVPSAVINTDIPDTSKALSHGHHNEKPCVVVDPDIQETSKSIIQFHSEENPTLSCPQEHSHMATAHDGNNTTPIQEVCD